LSQPSSRQWRTTRLTLPRENRFAVDPYWWRAAAITLSSFGNSLVRRREVAAFARVVAGTAVEPPLFVLGSGGAARFTSRICSLRGVYEALGLPDFGTVERALGRYLGTLSGYRKNTYPEIPPATRERIAREWRRCFQAWGYPA
jgi:hypothetical protein